MGLALAMILVVAAGVRLAHLDTESLWLDETFSVALARGPLATLAAESAKDVHPPFYFLLLSLWIRVVGDTAWAARLLSVACSVATVAVASAVTRRLFNRHTAAITALLLALSSFQITYAQEARMYALLALLATTSTFALIRMASKYGGDVPAGPRSPLVTPAWWAYAITTALLFYTHATSAFVVLAHGIALVASLRRPGAVRLLEAWLTAILAAVVAFLPWLATFAVQFLAVQEAFWVPPATWRNALDPFMAYAGSTTLVVVMGGAAAIGVVWTARRPDVADVADGPALSRTWLIGAWLVVPIAMPFLASLVGSPVFLPKYTIAASVPFAILAAAGLVAAPKLPRVALIVVIVVLSTQSIRAFYAAMPVKDDWRQATRDVERDAAPGDVVTFYPFFLEFAWQVYGTRTDLRVAPFERHAVGLTPPVFAAMFEDIVADRPRVWLVVLEYESRRGELLDHLRRRFSRVERRRYGHIDVFVADGRVAPAP